MNLQKFLVIAEIPLLIGSGLEYFVFKDYIAVGAGMVCFFVCGMTALIVEHIDRQNNAIMKTLGYERVKQ
jgi:hypothetical protein